MGGVRGVSMLALLLCLTFVDSGSVMAESHHEYDASSTLEAVIPSNLVLPQGYKPQQVLFATGVQIYVYNSTAWVLHNVSAELYNFKGQRVGCHYFLAEPDSEGGQPTWELFHPRSLVTAKKICGVSQQDSIDWLLLGATNNVGKKSLGQSAFVQRIFTQHGLPPAADYPAKAGDIFNSNYTSLYVFSASLQY